LPAEQFFDLAVAELHPGRAAMVALARARRDLHLAQKRVHFGDREYSPGADRAVAGDRRRDVVELVTQAQGPPELGDLGGYVGKEASGVRLAQRGRKRADEHCGRPEPLDLEAHRGELSGGALEAI